jgi:hypothetical protein
VSVNRPINIPHAQVNLANPVRFVKVNSLAGYGRFVAAVRGPTTGFTLSPPEKPPNMLRLSSFCREAQQRTIGAARNVAVAKPSLYTEARVRKLPEE